MLEHTFTDYDTILEELRLLRTDFNTYAREASERIAALEADNHALMGNGQPGRIAELGKSVDELKKWRWTAMGGGAVIVWIIEFLSHIH